MLGLCVLEVLAANGATTAAAARNTLAPGQATPSSVRDRRRAALTKIPRKRAPPRASALSLLCRRGAPIGHSAAHC